MSQRDRDRRVALKKAKNGLITQGQAAQELAISERQVRRLLVKLTPLGDKAVLHGLRGRPSNRRLSEQTSNGHPGRRMSGGSAEVASANWCSGTPRITTGWKAAARSSTSST